MIYFAAYLFISAFGIALSYAKQMDAIIGENSPRKMLFQEALLSALFTPVAVLLVWGKAMLKKALT